MNRAAAAPQPGPGGASKGRSILFAGVSKTFTLRDGQSTRAVDAVDLVVPAQQFVAVVGPSGCGKSTLLRLADGLLVPDQGQVRIGEAPPVPGPGIGMVFQTARLIPWRSVSENVRFALVAAGWPATDHDRLVQEHLRQVGLERWAAHYPAQLSGGMRQRVALARALAGQPDILLMDEPFANLDAQTRELMQEDLLALCTARRPTVLFVTHSVDEALLLADRVIVMGGGKLLDDVEVALPRPRSIAQSTRLPAFAEQRAHLWSQIRHLVLADPASAFFGRRHGPDASG